MRGPNQRWSRSHPPVAAPSPEEGMLVLLEDGWERSFDKTGARCFKNTEQDEKWASIPSDLAAAITHLPFRWDKTVDEASGLTSLIDGEPLPCCGG